MSATIHSFLFFSLSFLVSLAPEAHLVLSFGCCWIGVRGALARVTQNRTQAIYRQHLQNEVAPVTTTRAPSRQSPRPTSAHREEASPSSNGATPTTTTATRQIWSAGAGGSPHGQSAAAASTTPRGAHSPARPTSGVSPRTAQSPVPTGGSREAIYRLHNGIPSRKEGGAVRTYQQQYPGAVIPERPQSGHHSRQPERPQTVAAPRSPPVAGGKYHQQAEATATWVHEAGGAEYRTEPSRPQSSHAGGSGAAAAQVVTSPGGDDVKLDPGLKAPPGFKTLIVKGITQCFQGYTVLST